MNAGLLAGKYEIHPATSERWNDVEQLFGSNGAYAGCWCMFWRMPFKEYNHTHGAGTRALMQELTDHELSPGLLAYEDGEVAGWCSIGPREDYAGLERSKMFKRVDDTPVWSIVCFYVERKHRRTGMMAQLLLGAVDYAAAHGAQVVEAYPLDMDCKLLKGKKLTRYQGFMGIASVFSEAGFVKVQDATETQVIMRYQIPAPLKKG